jgi:SpoVK/Ycf46/Vps4 family AAA+-type ATPase
MEYHKGPCILTTNLRQNLDPAFARRFQMVIDFPRGDIKAREQLWEMYLPPKAPRHSDIDPTILASDLDLSAAQIRNVCLHAAFLAAGEENKIGLKQIAKAAWNEFSKDGREKNPACLGRLSSFLQEKGE